MFAYFNPQGSREPRRYTVCIHKAEYLFQSTRLSRASTQIADLLGDKYAFQSTRLSRASTHGGKGWLHEQPKFQSTRPSRASTVQSGARTSSMSYFNPQGPRGPRRRRITSRSWMSWNFNPQGPRGPRQLLREQLHPLWQISIHKALAGLDECNV